MGVHATNATHHTQQTHGTTNHAQYISHQPHTLNPPSKKALGDKQSLANFQASIALTSSAIHNTPMQISEPPNPEHLENNSNRHPPTTNVLPGLKLAI
jgi:hypothetical protein